MNIFKKMGNDLLRAADEETRGESLLVNLIIFSYLICIMEYGFADCVMITVSTAVINNVFVKPMIYHYFGKDGKDE